MITPNKVVTLNDSMVGHFHVILSHGPGSINIAILYELVRKEFAGIDEFLLALDALYVLGRIDIDKQTKSIAYADRDQV